MQLLSRPEALPGLSRPPQPDFVPLFAHQSCDLPPINREYTVELCAATVILLAFRGLGNANPTDEQRWQERLPFFFWN
jgi:hypothetical protein